MTMDPSSVCPLGHLTLMKGVQSALTVVVDPKKRAKADLVTWMNITRNILRAIKSIHTQAFADFPLEKSMFLPSPHIDHLTCQVCQCIPSLPIEVLTCRHYLCSSCITPETISCPCNSNTLLPDQLCAPSQLVLNMMGSLLVRCTQNCGQVIQLQHLRIHLLSNCVETEIPPPSAITVEQLLTTTVSDREPSLMVTHTRGLLAEKLFPSGRHVTCRSSSGKVCMYISDQLQLIKCLPIIIASIPCKGHYS